jgi:anti-anti-sigma factor
MRTGMRSAELEIRESLESGWLRLTLLGELDISGGPELQLRLEELQAEGRRVVMDLSQLKFMDSTGLAIMTKAIQSASSDGWSFVIDPNLTPQVRWLFNLTSLDRYAGIDHSQAHTA